MNMSNYKQPKMYRIMPRNEVTDPIKCVATLTPAKLVCGDAYLRMTTHIIKLIRP